MRKRKNRQKALLRQYAQSAFCAGEKAAGRQCAAQGKTSGRAERGRKKSAARWIDRAKKDKPERGKEKGRKRQSRPKRRTDAPVRSVCNKNCLSTGQRRGAEIGTDGLIVNAGGTGAALVGRPVFHIAVIGDEALLHQHCRAADFFHDAEALLAAYPGVGAVYDFFAFSVLIGKSDAGFAPQPMPGGGHPVCDVLRKMQ